MFNAWNTKALMCYRHELKFEFLYDLHHGCMQLMNKPIYKKHLDLQ